MLLAPTLLQTIVARYHLAPIVAVSPVSSGYLSHNFILETRQQKYFLKQYRFTELDPVLSAHQAKHFFAKGGLPVVLPLQDVAQQTIIDYNQKYYSLFPFIQARHLVRGQLSTTALRSMAQVQAQTHYLTQTQTIPPQIPVARIGNWNVEAFAETAQAILRQISQQRTKTPFDALTATVLTLKLQLVNHQAASDLTFDIKSDHLIHGDYHEANLFFDEHDQVAHIFDFERARLWSRLLELIRCVEFTCFTDGSQSGQAFAEQNFRAATFYFRTYHACYPFDKAELAQAYAVRYWDSIYSLWIESEHYLYQNYRVDGFLPGVLQNLQYFSQHRDDFVNRIMTGLET